MILMDYVLPIRLALIIFSCRRGMVVTVTNTMNALNMKH